MALCIFKRKDRCNSPSYYWSKDCYINSLSSGIYPCKDGNFHCWNVLWNGAILLAGRARLLECSMRWSDPIGWESQDWISPWFLVVEAGSRELSFTNMVDHKYMTNTINIYKVGNFCFLFRWFWNFLKMLV